MREIFSLVGRIGTEGFEGVSKNLEGIDKMVTKTAAAFDKFGRGMQKVGTNITKLTAPLAAVGVGITALAIKTGEYADRLMDLKEITGLSTDTLQEFENVARGAGVDFNTLTGTVQRFQGKLPQIIAGTGGASDAIKALGVSVFDSKGNVRDMNDLFPEMIKRLQSMTNTTERNAIAQQLFGKDLSALAPVLGLTSHEFEKLREEAHTTGMVMSEEALEAADKFRASVDQLKARFGGLGRELAMKFIPILQETVVPLIRDQMIPWLQKMGERIGAVATWFNNLSPGVKDAALKFGLIAVAIGPLLIGVGKLISMIKIAAATLHILTGAMLSNPFTLWITLIGLVIAAGVALYRNWDVVVDKLGDAWEWITYMYQQGVSYIRKAVYAAINGMLDMVSSVAGWVPGLRQALDVVRASMTAAAAAETALVLERRRARAEAQAEAKDNQELADTVRAAKEATEQYTTSTLAQVAAREKDEKAAKKQAEADEKLAEKKAEFESGWTNKLRAEIMTRSQNLEWEYREALSMASQYGANRQDIEQYYAIQRLKLAKDEADKKTELLKKEVEKRKETYEKTFSMATDAVNQIFSLMSQATDIQLEKIDQETEAQLASVDASTMSEEQKEKRKAEIELAADKKKRSLQRDQAKRDKAAAIFNAVINGFQAVSAALKLGAPLGIIMAVVMGALAAVQVGLIAAEPLPALASGGVVQQSPGGTHIIAGEGKEDEMILPMSSGVRKVVNDVVSGIRGFVGGQELPGSLGMANGAGMAMAGAGGGGGMHLHVGTLVADDSGMRNLERSLLKFRNQEAQRRGTV